jgi:hypothetical protein
MLADFDSRRELAQYFIQSYLAARNGLRGLGILRSERALQTDYAEYKLRTRSASDGTARSLLTHASKQSFLLLTKMGHNTWRDMIEVLLTLGSVQYHAKLANPVGAQCRQDGYDLKPEISSGTFPA